MKKVYLIRHALPDFPGGKRMCIGTTDLPLGEPDYAEIIPLIRENEHFLLQEEKIDA